MKHEESPVAANLKVIRAQRGLSLDALAELTGVSKSMLRQIETGKSSPTIATLWKIANGLKLSFTSLIAKPRPEVAILDFKGAPPLTSHEGRYRVYPMIPFDPEFSFESYYMEIEPGVGFHGEPHEGHTEEQIFVLQGSVEVVLADQRHMVHANQVVRFDANQPHDYHNPGRETMRAVFQICYLG